MGKKIELKLEEKNAVQEALQYVNECTVKLNDATLAYKAALSLRHNVLNEILKNYKLEGQWELNQN